MHPMTAEFLRSAYGGESMAHMRYVKWAQEAEKEGFLNVARLFKAISFAEQVHANNHFTVLKNESGAHSVTAGAGFGLGTTSQNLQGAIEGEEFEINEMYPVYMETAKFQGEKAAVVSFNYALSAEKIHAKMYRDAKESVDRGKDIKLGTVQICNVCGYTVEGDAPDQCPICKAKKENFTAFK